MWELVLILFFGKMVALTPEPITLQVAAAEFTPEAPLRAITSGAHLRVDVSKTVAAQDVESARKQADLKFPAGCVRATLLTRGGISYPLNAQGVSYAPNSIELTLSAEDGLPTDVDFARVRVSSCAQVEGAHVRWRNHKL